RVFYSWVDIDTSGNGLVGTSELLVPNLRIASARLTDGYQTCYKLITDTDLLWDGRILWPTMAPVVLEKWDQYHLPIVFAEMLQNDPLQQTGFRYLGNSALIFESDYEDPANLTLAYDGPCYINPGVGTPQPEWISFTGSHPNPFREHTSFDFVLHTSAHVQLSLFDLQGRKLVDVASGDYLAGTHSAFFDRTAHGGTALPDGIYLVRFTAISNDGQEYAVTRRVAAVR
ncbi:MAG: hypothetical protein AAF570_11620, partial [Bacteroidota bacterium]